MKKANHTGLEKYHRRMEASPEKREEYRDFSIFISDGGPYTDKRMINEYPTGWYEATWWLGRGDDVLGGQVLLFDFLHDLSMSNESRKQARIAAALHAAQVFIDLWHTETKDYH